MLALATSDHCNRPCAGRCRAADVANAKLGHAHPSMHRVTTSRPTSSPYAPSDATSRHRVRSRLGRFLSAAATRTRKPSPSRPPQRRVDPRQKDDSAAIEQIYKDYFSRVTSGDGDGACALLTADYQSQVTDQAEEFGGAKSCSEAVLLFADVTRSTTRDSLRSQSPAPARPRRIPAAVDSTRKRSHSRRSTGNGGSRVTVPTMAPRHWNSRRHRRTPPAT